MQDTTKILIATSLAHFVNDGGTFVFITLYPKLLPSDVFLIGVLGALQNLFSVVASPFVGRRADAGKSYGRLMSLGLIMMGVGIAGFAVSVLFFTQFSLFLFLIPFSLIAGIGGSFYHPIGAAALHEKWPRAKIGRAMGINGSMGSLGRSVYPLFVVTLVVYLTFPSLLILSVAAFVAASVISSLFYGIRFGKGASDIESSKDADERKEKKNIRPESVPMSVILPRILALTIVAFSRAVFSTGILNFIPVYLATDLNFGFGLELGIVFSAVLAAGVVGQPVFGYLADHFGRRLLLGISTIGTMATMLLFVGAHNPLLASIFMAFFGFFVFTGFPLIMPLANAAVPENAVTMSGSIVWGVGTIGGSAVGPFVIGLLAGPAFLGSLTSAFYASALFGLVAIGALPFVPMLRTK